jgi:3-deoxy-D-manno-octulosonic-acid transferase
MWRLLYPVLLVLAWPLVHARLVLRARREPEYAERTAERFGRVPPHVPPGCVWFHTVSAGETIAAAPLIAELARANTTRPFLVTTMTPTGSAQVRARLDGLVHHCYAPYDFPWAVNRFYRAVQPRLLVLMETELWPNLVAGAHRRGVPVLLVNARLSERSARGYRRLGGLSRRMLGQIDCIACQYADHADRFIALGARADRVCTCGSVKFDLVLPEDHARQVAALRDRFAMHDGPVWIAGSTHPGEEAQVLEAHLRLRERLPDVRLILVPRHPARAAELAGLCAARGLASARLSQPAAGDATAEVVVGDVMGTLLALYGVADVAFVGGSLVAHGGHNPVEPALCGLPVLMGPNVFNFAEVAARFREAGALRQVNDSDALTDALRDLVENPAARREAGARARRVIADNGGATVRLLELITAYLRAAGSDEDNRRGLG